jgi:hypothetical protein
MSKIRIIASALFALVFAAPAAGASHGAPRYDGQQMPPPSFWISLPQDNEVAILDAATHEIRRFATFPSVYGKMVVSTKQPLLFAAASGGVDFFNTNDIRLVGSVAMPTSVSGMAVSDFGNKLFVAAGNQIIVVSIPNRLIAATIPLKAAASGVAVVGQGHKLIATMPDAHELAIVSASTYTVERYVPTGRCVHNGVNDPCFPRDILPSPDGLYAVAVSGRNALEIDAKHDAVIANDEIKGNIFHAYALAVDPSNSTIWIKAGGSLRAYLSQINMLPPFNVVTSTTTRDIVDAAFAPDGVGYATWRTDVISFPVVQGGTIVQLKDLPFSICYVP